MTKRSIVLFAFIALLTQPSFAFALGNSAAVPTISNGTVVMPSRRAIRAGARAPAAANNTRLTIREVPLDKTFESPENGVKIQYPSSWQRFDLMEKNPPLTLIVMLLAKTRNGDGIRQNINLVTEDLPSPMSLADYTELGLAVERDFFEDYTLLKSEDTLIAGTYRAHRVYFTTKLPGGNMTFQQVWMLRGNKAHVWTFADASSVFDEHLGTFQRMLDTLTVR